MTAPTSIALHDPICPTTIRLQQRTIRSFVTTSPPDYLAAWLLDEGFSPVAKSHDPTEYGCFQLNGELLLLFWDGSVIASGAAWLLAAERLSAICEETPEPFCLFDLLDQCEVPL
jgi:hypothetical protein